MSPLRDGGGWRGVSRAGRGHVLSGASWVREAQRGRSPAAAGLSREVGRPKAPCGCAGDACQSRPGEKHSHSSPELSAPAVRRTGCKGRRAQPHSLDTLGAEEEGASEGQGRTAHPAALWAPTQERSRAASGAERTAAAPGYPRRQFYPLNHFLGTDFFFFFSLGVRMDSSHNNNNEHCPGP